MGPVLAEGCSVLRLHWLNLKQRTSFSPLWGLLVLGK